jgi:16S rRNA C967 or C1407 C5-methylase (RsmB/RsmF family)
MEKVNSKNEIDIKIDDFFGQVPSFKKFLQSQQIDPEEYKNNLKEYRKKGERFVRISSHLEKAEKQNIEELIKSCGGEKTLLENVFSLPLEKTISNLEIYQTGKIYGIDFGSIFVVEALNAKEGEKVLDICCAPGAKLLYIAEKVKIKEKGFIFGNDISLPRLNITKNMLKKYGYDSHVTLLNQNAKNLKNDSFECTFDKILVDVECTHDGSFKHVLKYIEPKEDRSKKIKKIEQKNDPKDDQKNSQNKQNQQKGDFGMLKPISKKEMKRRAQQLKVEKKNNWDISDFERNILNEEKIKNLNILQFDILINAISLV